MSLWLSDFFFPLHSQRFSSRFHISLNAILFVNRKKKNNNRQTGIKKKNKEFCYLSFSHGYKIFLFNYLLTF